MRQRPSGMFELFEIPLSDRLVGDGTGAERPVNVDDRVIVGDAEGDVRRITLILEVLNSHHAILKEPAPAVLLDDLGGGRMVFNASAFAVSPRAAYGVRSEILFEIVRRLQGAGIPMYEPPAIPSAPAA